MHKAVLALVIAALLPGAAQAQQALHVEFHTPAQANGSLAGINATWALIVFGDGDNAAFNISAPAGQDLNITYASVLQVDGLVFGGDTGYYAQSVQTTQQLPGIQATAHFNGIGSLYLHGAAIHLAADPARATLTQLTGGECLDHLASSHQRSQQDARYLSLCPEEGAVALLEPTAAMQVTVQADGLDALEWHHAQFTCPEAPCPDGGQRTAYQTGPPQLAVTNRLLGYHHFTTNGASIMGQGRAIHVFFGGPAFDVGVHGWIRLPLASGSACASCILPKNQTLSATGDVTLRGLHRDNEEWLSAGLQGSAVSARLDEQSISPQALLGLSAGTVIVVGAAGVAGYYLTRYLIRVIGVLFSRVRRAELPEPRQRVLHAIEAHPGAGLRELQQATGMKVETLKYQLRILESSGRIVEHIISGKRRFFENHGRYKHDWKIHAVLGVPELAQLFAWVKENSGQDATLAIRHHAKSAWGWTWGTTYYRLKKLRQAGLVWRVPDTPNGLLHALPAAPAQSGPESATPA